MDWNVNNVDCRQNRQNERTTTRCAYKIEYKHPTDESKWKIRDKCVGLSEKKTSKKWRHSLENHENHSIYMHRANYVCHDRLLLSQHFYLCESEESS